MCGGRQVNLFFRSKDGDIGHYCKDQFVGPLKFVNTAYLEMHPLYIENRIKDLKTTDGISYCNVKK